MNVNNLAKEAFEFNLFDHTDLKATRHSFVYIYISMKMFSVNGLSVKFHQYISRILNPTVKVL